MFRTYPKPKILVFFTSFQCDLRCAMCFAWAKQKQTNQLSLRQIQGLFNDKLIRNYLEIVNITGGEPTLRRDLTEIIEIILEKCRCLKRIDLSTNGVSTAQIVDQVERILALLLPTNVRLTVNVSLDGVGKIHEQIRGVADIFTKIEQTMTGLKELLLLYPFFSLGLNATISRLNYQAIEELREYAAGQGLGINFTLAALSDIGVESVRVREEFEMTQEEKKRLSATLEGFRRSGGLDRQNAKFMLTWLKTGKRRARCAFQRGRAFLLEPDGEAYVCGNFKQFKIGNIAEQPLEEVWRNAASRLKSLDGKCTSCNSNCYMEQA